MPCVRFATPTGDAEPVPVRVVPPLLDAHVAVNPLTNAVYLLLRDDVYERLRPVLDADDARHMAPLLADLDPEDWVDASVYEDKS